MGGSRARLAPSPAGFLFTADRVRSSRHRVVGSHERQGTTNPVFDGAGEPKHVRGVVADEPGLYFVGLLFLYAAVSDVLPGVGRDAEHIAKHIASREPIGPLPASVPT